MKRIEIKPGQKIQFRVEGQDEWHKGVLWGCGPEMVNISGDSIDVNSLVDLAIPLQGEAAHWNKMVAANLKKAALVYATMQGVNRPWDSWTRKKGIEVVVTVVALWFAGKFMQARSQRKYSAKRNWRIYIRPPFRWAPGQQGENGKSPRGQRFR